jgi:hypothetical protein
MDARRAHLPPQTHKQPPVLPALLPGSPSPAPPAAAPALRAHRTWRLHALRQPHALFGVQARAQRAAGGVQGKEGSGRGESSKQRVLWVCLKRRTRIDAWPLLVDEVANLLCTRYPCSVCACMCACDMPTGRLHEPHSQKQNACVRMVFNTVRWTALAAA